MDKYIEFINKLGLFVKIINLESLIDYYKGSCLKNENQVCYSNLKNSLNECLREYQLLLNENKYENRDHLKREILDEWDNVSKILLSDNVYNVRNKDGKLIYGMILEIVKVDLDFSSIYLFLIENDLYDPNVACWVSLEPFYSILPMNNLLLFKEANKRVILDSRTDFHILRNASDTFEYASYYYRHTSNEEEKMYWHEYLLWTLSGNLSVLDSRRFKELNKKIYWNYTPLVYQIYGDETFAYLADYLSLDEAIEKQCCNTLYPSEERTKALDFYIKELEKRGVTNSHLLELKKSC